MPRSLYGDYFADQLSRLPHVIRLQSVITFGYQVNFIVRRIAADEAMRDMCVRYFANNYIARSQFIRRRG